MTFLLQKFNAINRTRTEVRARSGLRSSAGSIAFTSRFAACLLLAGFLGVGSVVAQPHVLRMGDGAVTISTELADGTTDGKVHHYKIGDADAVQDPTTNGTVNTFLVGNLALVTFDDGTDMITISPVATGAFKIALDASAAGDLSDNAKPYEFEIVSGNAPELIGVANNQAAVSDVVNLELTPRDDSSKEYDLLKWFSDPNDVFLSYDASVDMVAKDDSEDFTNLSDKAAPRRDKVAKDGATILSATVVGSKLTVALTGDAKEYDQTDIWVFARDGSEYARKRIQVTIGVATLPYVDGGLSNDVLREDAAADATYSLSTGFMDPDVAEASRLGSTTLCDDPLTAGDCIVNALTYTAAISDNDATGVPANTGTVSGTWVTSSMSATLTVGTSPTLAIRPRAPGSATFTITGTDRGRACRDGYAFTAETADPAAAAKCVRAEAGTQGQDDYVAYDSTGTFPDAKSVKHSFTVTVVTRTTPVADAAIPAQTGDKALSAEGDAVTIDLEDLNGDAANAPRAFADATGEGLTYTVTAKQVNDKDVVTVGVDGSMLTLTPLWRAGDATAEVTVTATNNIEEMSLPVMFHVAVKTATKPVVNPALAALLPSLASIELATGATRTWNLQNINGAKEAKDALPLFIDPNATAGDALPGGLLYSIKPEDVDSPYRYDDLSRENHVVTSAGSVVLDPMKAMLTITGTAANYMNVTINAVDRERDSVSVTVAVMVVSGTSAEGEELPTEVALSQNYPNPFNPQTTIDYALPQAGDVSLVVYDMLGREVDVLIDGPQAAGRHTVRFGANHLPNGTYVYRLVAGEKTITRTMVLVK